MGRALSSVSVAGVSKSFGPHRVLSEVDLSVEPGEFLVLLGRSGSGKSTLLRVIAGLERIEAGSVELDGVLVSGGPTHVPTEARNLGMVFQDGALFPHLTVARNVGFGLPRPERKGGPRVEEMLDLVGMAGLGERMPHELSGGQRQRVALARALAPRPSVMLLDEPFANLDFELRLGLRREVRRLLGESGVSVILVTHDRNEALALGDRIAVLEESRITQCDTPSDLYRHPRTRWAAHVLGEAAFVSPSNQPLPLLRSWCAELAAVRQPLEDSTMVIRPEDLTLVGSGFVGSGFVDSLGESRYLRETEAEPKEGLLGATVVRTEYQGGSHLLWCRCPELGDEVRSFYPFFHAPSEEPLLIERLRAEV